MAHQSLYYQSSIPFWSGFVPVNGGGRIHPTLTAISPTPTLHLAQFKASSFSKPTLLLSCSTCIFHVFFGYPCFLLPFTSNSNAFLKTCASSLYRFYFSKIDIFHLEACYNLSWNCEVIPLVEKKNSVQLITKLWSDPIGRTKNCAITFWNK